MRVLVKRKRRKKSWSFSSLESVNETRKQYVVSIVKCVSLFETILFDHKSDIYHYRSIQILNDYSSYKSTPHHFVQAVAQKNHFWIALQHTFPPEGLSTINGDHARGPRERKIYRGTREAVGKIYKRRRGWLVTSSGG